MTKKPCFVRAYLRASTEDQDATRARQMLIDFAASHGHVIASFYTENETGTKLYRPELMRLLNDAQPGDILLCEQVDRLSRLNNNDWLKLRSIITSKGVHVVALDLPTSYQLMNVEDGESFTGRLFGALNSLLLDMLAAIARKDYEDRVRRTSQGIATARAEGKFKGRAPNKQLHADILALLKRGIPIRQVGALLKCSATTVKKVKAAHERAQEPETEPA
jgi:DNA invertase Pin-like site-specific DNA recombinase